MFLIIMDCTQVEIKILLNYHHKKREDSKFYFLSM